MKSLFGCMVAVALVAATASTAFAELTKEQAEALRLAREQACERLAKRQREDGSWRLDPEHAGPWDAAFTALATHALYQAWVNSASMPIYKGMIWIAERVPDGKPPADGLAAICLAERHPERYRKSLDRRVLTLVAARVKTGDPSDSLFIAGALDALRQSGVEIPEAVWQQARKDFIAQQNADGSWTPPPDIDKESLLGASGEPDRHFATVAALAALHIARDGLRKEGKEDRELDAVIGKAFDWLAKNPKKEYSPFEWYAIERLRRWSGHGDFDGRPWRAVARDAMIKRIADEKTSPADLAFALLVLHGADVPLDIAKLRTRGDWNAFPDDVRQLVNGYLSNKFCRPYGWEIVSLDADAGHLATIPVLYLSGGKPLDFTEAEKKKLKDYVDAGGVLLAARTGDGDAFEKSIRALVAELWPDGPFTALDRTHRIFSVPRPLKGWIPDGGVVGLILPGERERVGVLYVSDPEFARMLSRGGEEATGAYDLGANVAFYGTLMAARRADTKPAAE